MSEILSMRKSFTICPIGVVTRQDESIWIDIFDDYSDGLLGLDGFSHINVLFWFHENDNPQKRAVLQVHPRRDKQNPLTGVFATRAPYRPNPIAMTTCKLLGVDEENGLVEVADLDAFDGTAVVDLKAYFPVCDRVQKATIPDWLAGWPEWMPDEGIGFYEED